MSHPDRSIERSTLRPACLGAERRGGRRAQLGLAALLAISIAGGGAGSAAADANDGAITLTNDHVGMTRAQIDEARTPPPSPAPAQAAEPAPQPRPSAAGEAAPGAEPSEATPEALSLEAAAAEADRRAQAAADRAATLKRAVEAAEAGLIPGLGPNQEGEATFDRCMEATIRRGEGFDAADRLCRAIYYDVVW